MDWKDRNVVVLGLGDTGLSMTRWLARRGAAVRVADTRSAPPQAATLARELPQVALSTGPFSGETVRGADLIAVSPGIDRRRGPVADAARRGVPVVGDVELFARALHSAARRQPPAARPKVIAVTGSNGKSTVTAMAGEIGKAAGRATVVAGNIGLPVLDALAAVEEGSRQAELFVLELSSFQLESTERLESDAAAVLNISEDHLDRYDSLEDYAAAKARVFTGSGVQVLNRDDAATLAMARPGRRTLTFGRQAPTSPAEWGIAGEGAGRALANHDRILLALAELPLAGLHNAANALAALALAQAAGMPETSALDALRRFKGLPHRMCPIARIADVTYYDDSKATNVGATLAALSGMDRPVVLIAGGDGKGQAFAPLAAAVRARARAVVLIGRDAGLIEQALGPAGKPVVRAGAMEDAVEQAARAARAGDAVLLSPACASYDMYRDYVHRAEAFAAAVRRLQDARG